MLQRALRVDERPRRGMLLLWNKVVSLCNVNVCMWDYVLLLLPSTDPFEINLHASSVCTRAMAHVSIGQEIV